MGQDHDIAKRLAARWLGSRESEFSNECQYLAAFLTKMSKQRLLRDFPAVHDDIRADHMTIQFAPSEAEAACLQIGKKVKLKVVGYAEDDKGQAVVVVPKGVRSERPIPHITISTIPGVGAIYSNNLLAAGYEPVVGPTLEAVLDTFPNQWTHRRRASSERVADRWMSASTHRKSVALMKFLSKVARRAGVGDHVYVVGGAVRNWVIDQPIKDIDVMIDSVALGGKDSEWFAKQLQRAIPAATSLVTNQYGVAILTVSGPWVLDGEDLKGEVIEIANARKESYGGTGGKGYKPSEVVPATAEEDVARREFTFNTLMWRLSQLADGPDKAEIVDLTGCGMRDLQEGVMRCPSDPDKTFSDDPTRMLRAIKFLVKYGFRISGEVEDSIRRNAQKIKQAPQNAISTLLIDTILKEPRTARKALSEMQRLGLLDIISEMVHEDQAFRSTMQNWAGDQRLLFLFDMLDVGLPLDSNIRFLDPSQQARLREVAMGMEEGEPEEYLAALRQPGRALQDKKFLPQLAGSLGIRGKEMGPFMNQIQDFMREALLDDPTLMNNPSHLKRLVEQEAGA